MWLLAVPALAREAPALALPPVYLESALSLPQPADRGHLCAFILCDSASRDSLLKIHQKRLKSIAPRSERISLYPRFVARSSAGFQQAAR